MQLPLTIIISHVDTYHARMARPPSRAASSREANKRTTGWIMSTPDAQDNCTALAKVTTQPKKLQI